MPNPKIKVTSELQNTRQEPNFRGPFATPGEVKVRRRGDRRTVERCSFLVCLCAHLQRCDGRKLIVRAEAPKGEVVRYDSKRGQFISIYAWDLVTR
jgi:hypothetical protein